MNAWAKKTVKSVMAAAATITAIARILRYLLRFRISGWNKGPLEILGKDLVKRLRVFAGRAFFGSFHSFGHVAAVYAMPFDRGLLFKYFSVHYVAYQPSISRFVEFLSSLH